jgi:hypothetical protein
MEVIIKDHIVQFLIKKGLRPISKSARVCTARNLLDWSIGLNSHLPTDIVNIDSSKAFDSIVLSKLLF